jgi:hypothetical protein
VKIHFRRTWGQQIYSLHCHLHEAGEETKSTSYRNHGGNRPELEKLFRTPAFHDGQLQQEGSCKVNSRSARVLNLMLVSVLLGFATYLHKVSLTADVLVALHRRHSALGKPVLDAHKIVDGRTHGGHSQVRCHHRSRTS